MAKHIPFTEQEKKVICNLWKQGYTATQICKMVDTLNNRKPQTLYPILIKANLYKKKPANDLRRFKVNDHYFDNINNEHKAYWLGFMLADGFISNSGHATESFGMILKKCDSYILEKFKKDLKATYIIHDYREVHDWGDGPVVTYVSKLFIKSPIIYKRLMELGFSTDKSHHAVIPYDEIPNNLISHFIRGYFDGDGSLAKSGDKKWHIFDLKFTGTYEVISGIRHLVGKDNVKLSQRHPERDNNNYSLNLCGDLQCYNICKWMYKDATIYLERKYKRYKILESKYALQSKK